jgi:hypothetical protein
MFRQKVLLPSPRSQDAIIQLVKPVADDKLTTVGPEYGTVVPTAHEETVQSGFTEYPVVRGCVPSEPIRSGEGRFCVSWRESAEMRIYLCMHTCRAGVLHCLLATVFVFSS